MIHHAGKPEGRGFCPCPFLAGVFAGKLLSPPAPARQAEYLQAELARGKKGFILYDGPTVGVVTMWGGLIENLYVVLPSEQRKGYGRSCCAMQFFNATRARLCGCSTTTSVPCALMRSTVLKKPV
ncbi:MAG: hypothetical protein ACOYI3_02540 [Christensenellales bacterium]